MKTLFIFSLVALLAPTFFAKRTVPVDVPPVATDAAVFSAPHFADDENGSRIRGGFVEARHPETGALLWRVRVYQTEYDRSLETDVQDVFIKTLSHDKVHDVLILSDEKERVFVLDAKTRKVYQIR